jgi:hypothetical protein
VPRGSSILPTDPTSLNLALQTSNKDTLMKRNANVPLAIHRLGPEHRSRGREFECGEEAS